jgi:hypothetical protein
MRSLPRNPLGYVLACRNCIRRVMPLPHFPESSQLRGCRILSVRFLNIASAFPESLHYANRWSGITDQNPSFCFILHDSSFVYDSLFVPKSP